MVQGVASLQPAVREGISELKLIFTLMNWLSWIFDDPCQLPRRQVRAAIRSVAVMFVVGPCIEEHEWLTVLAKSGRGLSKSQLCNGTGKYPHV
jgi:hypothetical protein